MYQNYNKRVLSCAVFTILGIFTYIYMMNI